MLAQSFYGHIHLCSSSICYLSRAIKWNILGIMNAIFSHRFWVLIYSNILLSILPAIEIKVFLEFTHDLPIYLRKKEMIENLTENYFNSESWDLCTLQQVGKVLSDSPFQIIPLM